MKQLNRGLERRGLKAAFAGWFALLLCLTNFATGAQAQQKLVLDDFENGVAKWTTNDKTKTETSPATLIEVLPASGSNLVPNSKGAALFTFKAAQNSWASASLKVDGKAWAAIGGRSLSFYLNAGGNATGVEVLIRRATGKGDEAFRLPWPVRLVEKKWRKVAIPLSDFKSDRDKAPLTSRLNGVYLLQFVMRNSWDARFFTVDHLQVEGTGKPILAGNSATSTPPSTDATPAAPATPTTPVTNISVDYLRLQGKIRTGANVNVGAGVDPQDLTTYPLNESSEFRSAIRELKSRFIRLDAGQYADLLDSSRPAFDFTRLQQAVIATRAINAQPLIAISLPAEWNLNASGYASFAAQAARALNAANVGPANYFELAVGASTLDDANVVAYYNAARTAIKRAQSSIKVGGVSASAGRTSTLRAILRGAAGLDFLMVQDFGVMGGNPTDKALLDGARGISRLRAVAASLDASKFKSASLFVISNLNASRQSEHDVPTDSRTDQMISGAWWGVYLGNASRYADQVFHSNASVPEWGLLDDAVRAFPAYYAMWLWNTYAPAGSDRVLTNAANSDIYALGFNTQTAHNLILVNTQPEERTAQISIRGFPVLRQARIRVYDDPRTQPTLVNLPKSPFQTIKLRPYAAAVVQFIEPPKGE